MAQAILDGRKTQTRRVIKPQPSSEVRKSVFVKSGIEDGHGREIKPKYQPGDILWVRETWATVSSGIIEYKATYKEPYTGSAEVDHIGNKIKWRPSIFMPREAARIFLKVKEVSVERLIDISDSDVVNEGFQTKNDFFALWDKLNYHRGFGVANNPFVWKIEFERVIRQNGGQD